MTDSARSPISVKKGEGGRIFLVSSKEGRGELDLTELTKPGKSLSLQWKAELEDCEAIDLSGLDHNAQINVIQKFDCAGAREGATTPHTFLVDGVVSRARLQNLLDINRFEVRVLTDEKTQHRVAQIAAGILKKLNAANVEGPGIEYHLAHLDDEMKIMDDLIVKAQAGELRGRHLVVVFCIPHEASFRKLMVLRDAALQNGAASVTAPSDAVNIPAMVLTALEINRSPSLLEGATPAKSSNSPHPGPQTG